MRTLRIKYVVLVPSFPGYWYYSDDNYQHSTSYWHIMGARLAFVVVFEVRTHPIVTSVYIIPAFARGFSQVSICSVCLKVYIKKKCICMCITFIILSMSISKFIQIGLAE